MKGLTTTVRDLGQVDLRLGKLYGLKRLSREDYERLMARIQELRDDLESTVELEGICFGDPESQTPWTPKRIEAYKLKQKEEAGL